MLVESLKIKSLNQMVLESYSSVFYSFKGYIVVLTFTAVELRRERTVGSESRGLICSGKWKKIETFIILPVFFAARCTF
jgi:hypothetical protein